MNKNLENSLKEKLLEEDIFWKRNFIELKENLEKEFNLKNWENKYLNETFEKMTQKIQDISCQKEIDKKKLQNLSQEFIIYFNF